VPGSWEPFGSTRIDPPADAAAPATPAAPEAAPLPPARREPARGLAVITCMDARIDPLGVLGLSLGDANVIRNAGATVSDDVLRSLHAAESILGVRRAVLIGHTDCAGHGSDAAASAAMADGARRIRGVMPDGFAVDAFMYDVATGSLNPVQPLH
jgi:carbonic anhydrase